MTAASNQWAAGWDRLVQAIKDANARGAQPEQPETERPPQPEPRRSKKAHKL